MMVTLRGLDGNLLDVERRDDGSLWLRISGVLHESVRVDAAEFEAALDADTNTIRI
jgi:hypothetical protein